MANTTAGWSRPPGPINVWKIVEIEQKLQDGSTRPARISIQEVPEDRREESLEHMIKYFIVDEPIAKSQNTKDDPKMIHDFRILWSFCLDQGIVEAAYLIDTDGKIADLVSVNMLCVMSKETKGDLEKLLCELQSPKFTRIIEFMREVEEKADALEIFGVDKYLAAFGLNVSPRFRGQKIGLRMLEARDEIGKKYGIPVSSTVFTARASQILAERAGYEEKYSHEYALVLDDSGQPFFPNIESKELKIMMKRLY